jgi:hypothetical protein
MWACTSSSAFTVNRCIATLWFSSKSHGKSLCTKPLRRSVGCLCLEETPFSAISVLLLPVKVSTKSTEALLYFCSSCFLDHPKIVREFGEEGGLHCVSRDESRQAYEASHLRLAN